MQGVRARTFRRGAVRLHCRTPSSGQHPNLVERSIAQFNLGPLTFTYSKAMDIGAFPDPFLESAAMDEFLQELASGESISMIGNWNAHVLRALRSSSGV